MSWNVRGFGDSIKRSKIRKYLDLFKVNWVVLQETNLSSFYRYIVQ